MPFPLFDLPAEAVDLVLSCVDDPKDERALRLVCKRSRAAVDSRVVAVRYRVGAQLPALVRAPWQLQVLSLSRWVGDAGAAALHLSRRCNSLGPAGAASLAAAHWPALQELDLAANYLGDAGAAALAAARWPALQTLHLNFNGISSAGEAALHTRWPTAELHIW